MPNPEFMFFVFKWSLELNPITWGNIIDPMQKAVKKKIPENKTHSHLCLRPPLGRFIWNPISHRMCLSGCHCASHMPTLSLVGTQRLQGRCGGPRDAR